MPNPSLPPGVFADLSGRPRQPEFEWLVYRLRHQGTKTTEEAIRGTHAVGLLRAAPIASGDMHATLRSSYHGRPVIESLSDVRILKIDRGGVLISGIERVHAHDNKVGVSLQPFPQTWWCVPEPWEPGKPG